MLMYHRCNKIWRLCSNTNRSPWWCLLLELISETLYSSSIKVPVFIISETAEEIIAFTNALPEWLCKSRQEKLFSGEALFGHMELLKEGKLFLFPNLHSKGLLMEGALYCDLSTLEP